MPHFKVERELNGKLLTIETGKIARQADNAVTVALGNNVVLVTFVAEDKPKEGVNFLPLVCDYEEKLYAAGKIPGGFIKREGRPSEQAVLTSRLIDRPIRPLFPEEYYNQVQIIALPLSADLDSPPDILAVIGASSCLYTSKIPVLHPVGIVRIGRLDSKFIANPTYDEINKGDLDLVIAGNKDRIIMVECKAKEISEQIIIDAIDFGTKYLVSIIEIQEELREKIGVKKEDFIPPEKDIELNKKVKKLVLNDLENILHKNLEKADRETEVRILEEKAQELLKEEFPEKESEITKIINQLEKEIVRRMVLEENRRVDGRGFKEIRKIECEVGLLPRVHGSGLFTRGETQVLTITTLGAVGDEQIIDGLTIDSSKRFMHQYNFPPYSVGEIKPLRGPGRREIGHGALGEKSLEAVIPDQSVFPYTIRLVSEVLSSNGSTSMASVCGSTLSLMDAGIPIKKPVSGIAMGLFKEGEKNFILSDIQGIEDAFGDMDFKVAGTVDGITALQLDVKTKEGIDVKILSEALAQAKEGRIFILEKMLSVINKPRANLSSYAPRVFTLDIPQDKVGELIGPGGKNIKKIIEETKVQIDIQEGGKVFITSPDEEKGKQALKMVQNLTKEIKVGEKYLGKVLRIVPFGAFIEILPGKEGLLHISQISRERIDKVESVMKVGDEILVEVMEIDEQGRFNLTRKTLLPPSNSYRNRR